MQTLIQHEVKPKLANLNYSTYQVKEKLNKARFFLELKFYQKLLLLLLTSCILLIFPESPYDSEILCKRNHSAEACIVW